MKECIYGKKPYDYVVKVDGIILRIQSQLTRSVYIISLFYLI